MFPAVFLALPLLLPMPSSSLAVRGDIVTAAPIVTFAPPEHRVTALALRGPLIPPLYARQDGGLSLSLSPGSPCTAACLRLQVTF